MGSLRNTLLSPASLLPSFYYTDPKWWFFSSRCLMVTKWLHGLQPPQPPHSLITHPKAERYRNWVMWPPRCKGEGGEGSGKVSIWDTGKGKGDLKKLGEDNQQRLPQWGAAKQFRHYPPSGCQMRLPTQAVPGYAMQSQGKAWKRCSQHTNLVTNTVGNRGQRKKGNEGTVIPILHLHNCDHTHTYTVA